MLSAMRLFQFQADIKYRRQSSSLHTPFCVQSVFGINLFRAVRHRSLSHRVCRSRSVNGVHTGSNSPDISTNYFRAGCLQWKLRGCGRRTYTVMKARGWPYFIGPGGVALPVHSLAVQPYLLISGFIVRLMLVLFVWALPLFVADDADPHAFRVTGPPPAAWPNSTRTGLKFAAHQ